MKKSTILLLTGGSLLLSSCEYDSIGVSYSASSYHRVPVYVEPVRHHRYRVPPPDWMRYGGNWAPARSHHSAGRGYSHCRY